MICTIAYFSATGVCLYDEYFLYTYFFYVFSFTVTPQHFLYRFNIRGKCKTGFWNSYTWNTLFSIVYENNNNNKNSQLFDQLISVLWIRTGRVSDKSSCLILWDKSKSGRRLRGRWSRRKITVSIWNVFFKVVLIARIKLVLYMYVIFLRIKKQFYERKMTCDRIPTKHIKLETKQTPASSEISITGCFIGSIFENQ